MSDIVIERLRNGEDAISVFQQVDALLDEVRRKAFSLFEEKGCLPGHDLDDWLAAEHEIFWWPPLALIENQEEFRVRVAVSGFEPKDILVTATPDTIILQAESGPTQAEQGDLRVAEFSARRLYRRLDLPSPIDLDRIKATSSNGVLKLVAAKAVPDDVRKIHVETRQAA